MPTKADLKSAIEKAFGPGAFDLLDEEDALDLLESAEESAEKAAEPDEPSGDLFQQENGLLVFEVSGECFALPIANVVEIQRLPDISWIPHMPGWLSGVVSLRGTVVSAVDLCLFLNASAPRLVGGELMVVVRSLADGMTTAVVANKVAGIRRLASNAYSQPRVEGSEDESFVSTTIECDGRSTTVLDLERLLNSNAMRLFQSA